MHESERDIEIERTCNYNSIGSAHPLDQLIEVIIETRV